MCQHSISNIPWFQPRAPAVPVEWFRLQTTWLDRPSPLPRCWEPRACSHQIGWKDPLARDADQPTCWYFDLAHQTESQMYTCQITLDISGRPIDIQWGSRKYPGDAYLPSYPGYFRKPHWYSMGLPGISRVTWQVCIWWSAFWISYACYTLSFKRNDGRLVGDGIKSIFWIETLFFNSSLFTKNRLTKTSFNVSSNIQCSHPDNLSISVFEHQCTISYPDIRGYRWHSASQAWCSGPSGRSESEQRWRTTRLPPEYWPNRCWTQQ